MRRERAGRGKPTSGPAPLHAAVGVGCASSRVAAGSAGVSCCNPRCSPSQKRFDTVREGWQARAQIPNADRTFPSTLPPPTGQCRPGERWSERPALRARRDVEAFPRVAVPAASGGRLARPEEPRRQANRRVRILPPFASTRHKTSGRGAMWTGQRTRVGPRDGALSPWLRFGLPDHHQGVV
jgi:hypothetical protein